MKKLKINFLLAIAFMFVMPLALMLTGCGATPASSVQTVKFVSDIYDSVTGYPVFEVDLNKETKLEYKITPSTGLASPTMAVLDFYSDSNRSKFELFGAKQTVIVYEEDFIQVTIKIFVGTYEDICIVRLKEYPVGIYLDNNATSTHKEDYVNAGGEYTIHVFGNFSKDVNSPLIREVTDNEFNFLVESNDTTVLDVLNSSRLKVCTLKNKIETATISVYLLDTHGNKMKYADGTEMKLTVRLTVVLPPSSANLLLEGHDQFIEDGETVDIVATDGQFETELGPSGEWHYHLLDYTIDLFTSDGVYLERDMYTITVTTNQDKFVRIDNDLRHIKIRQPNNVTTLSAVITVTSSANVVDGSAFSMSFTLNFTFPPEA